MNNLIRKSIITGLVCGAALTMGCQRTYQHKTYEEANPPASSEPGTGGSGSPDGTAEPKTGMMPMPETGAQYGAAGQKNDVNTEQDMGIGGSGEEGYGGSGKADGGMMMHGDGGMMMHGDGGMMMHGDGGMMMHHMKK